MEAQSCTDQKNCDIESRGCGPCSDLYLQSLAWAKTTEPRTGVEFPTMLDNTISGESNSCFTPEVGVYSFYLYCFLIDFKKLSNHHLFVV